MKKTTPRESKNEESTFTPRHHLYVYYIYSHTYLSYIKKIYAMKLNFFFETEYYSLK